MGRAANHAGRRSAAREWRRVAEPGDDDCEHAGPGCRIWTGADRRYQGEELVDLNVRPDVAGGLGWYDDEIVRTENGFKIARRSLTMVLFETVGTNLAAAS